MMSQSIVVIVLASFFVGFSSAANDTNCECKSVTTFGKNFTVTEEVKKYFETVSFSIDFTASIVIELQKLTNVTAAKLAIEALLKFEEIVKVEVDTDVELVTLVKAIQVQVSIVSKLLVELEKEKISASLEIQIKLLVVLLEFFKDNGDDIVPCTCAKNKN